MFVLLILNKTNFGIEKDLMLFILLIILIITIMERKEVVSELLKNGAKLVKGVRIKTIKIADKDTYTRLTLNIDKPVKGYVADDAGEFHEDDVKYIFVSMFTILSLLREDDDASFAVNHFTTRPEAMQVLLANAEIDVVQEPVTSGQEYTNPFSSSDNKVVFDHDTYINHAVSIKLSEKAKTMLEKLAESMMGI